MLSKYRVVETNASITSDVLRKRIQCFFYFYNKIEITSSGPFVLIGISTICIFVSELKDMVMDMCNHRYQILLLIGIDNEIGR